MVADALVYHPTVAHYLRFVGTTVGRDKVLRFIQYFSRFYAWYLFRTNNPETAIAPWNNAKKTLGATRKIMRVGKFVEHLKAAAVASDNKSADPILRSLAVSRQIGYAGYLTLDNLCVLDSTGIRKWEGAKRLGKEAARFWMFGLASSIVSGVYKLNGLRLRRGQVDRKEGEGVVESKKIEREWNTARLQLISDCCDICLPATNLGILGLDDGILGLAGSTSSLIGLYNAWEKVRQ
ncbi:putative peroxisomal membrane protein PMP27 [Microthyrium microscopicum]|uniref:Putative peroxisomal membrane protein PMP27 n=1 Tax=Microthyrium microscopicum TaxID=703497 RepID=A0A6A6UEA1_9PEZI|nr:putative peroxisomal membrane protein PMP27 [Microthyrium microscopicum]